PAWNTELADQPPTAWEELADPRWDERLGMERTNAEWYMALSNYWTEEAGKSPEEVQQLWEDIVQGALMVQGHSPLRQLLISGEFAAVPSLYSYMVEEAQGNGAPLEWQPPVEPLIVGPNGIGVIVNTPNPAGAMLFTDWLLTDGQQHISDAGIESVQTDLQQLGDVETYAIDVEQFSDEQDRWMSELERLTGLGEAAPQT
ncbi:MAG TPA: extracellular solute-binding protein, partial [Dermatophilaceae bacterium]|nr:extracellular solute-binding protein [Dermatophilaceae bacterium]